MGEEGDCLPIQQRAEVRIHGLRLQWYLPEDVIMPSKSGKQARFMRACDSGWSPPKWSKAECPPKDVSHEFVVADRGVQKDGRTVEAKGYRKGR